MFTTNALTQQMLLVFADKHPYLYTLISVTTPTLWVILVVAGFNVVNGVLRGRRR